LLDFILHAMYVYQCSRNTTLQNRQQNVFSDDSSLLDVNVFLLAYWALMMKALPSFELSATIYNPIWHNILGDSNYQQHRRKNLWPHIVQTLSFSRLCTYTGLQSVPYWSSKVTCMHLFSQAICLPKHATLGLITGISHAKVQKKSTPSQTAIQGILPSFDVNCVNRHCKNGKGYDVNSAVSGRSRAARGHCIQSSRKTRLQKKEPI
jgi:hypothetical protein